MFNASIAFYIAVHNFGSLFVKAESGPKKERSGPIGRVRNLRHRRAAGPGPDRLCLVQVLSHGSSFQCLGRHGHRDFRNLVEGDFRGGGTLHVGVDSDRL